MKFGDKLILLRKQKGLSQEELAEKLGVSRQSVSKWESNYTYPETDKIVQICNLFDCSMDDLINENITNIEQTMRKNKMGINEAIDSLLDFITKTVNMFSHMNFMTGLKCVLEMIVLAIILYIIGNIIGLAAGYIISHIFVFLQNSIKIKLQEFITSIFLLIWFIASIIIWIHTFKLRYLNYYENDANNEIKPNSKEQKGTPKEEEKEKCEKIIIRDEKDKPFAFLSIFSKIIIYGIKFILFWILLSIVAVFICLIIGDVLLITMIPTNLIFLGMTIAAISISIITAQILILGIHFIINKKANAKVHIIIFLMAIILSGIGISTSIISLKNFKIINEINDIYKPTEKTITTEYMDNLSIKSNYGPNTTYQYIVNNEIENNQINITKKIDPKFEKISLSHIQNMDNMKEVYLWTTSTGNYKDIFDIIINDLKKNQIHANYDYIEEEIITIEANEETIHKLIQNLQKLYLVSTKVTDNKTLIQIKDSKVYFPNGIDGTYDAIEEKLNLNPPKEEYDCIRSTQTTEWGEKIIYTCNYNKRYDES